MNKDLIRGGRLGVTAVLQRFAGPGSIALVCLVLSLAGDSGRRAGRYDRAALVSGELWRLVTAHLVHLSWGHVALNLSALAIMAALLDGVLDTFEWYCVGLAAALGIDVGLYFLSPEVEWYVGLSGVLHGWLAAGALRLVLEGELLGWPLLLGVAGKVLWEQWAGPLPFSESSSGGPVVVDAHLYGALSGIVGIIGINACRARPAKL